jgi:hypothetical protein
MTWFRHVIKSKVDNVDQGQQTFQVKFIVLQIYKLLYKNKK